MFYFFLNYAAAPTAPSSVTLANIAFSNDVSLSWTDNSSDEITFNIQYQVNGGSWTAAADDTTSPSLFVPSGAVSTDSVKARVRAQGAAVSSEWVESNTISYDPNAV